MKNITKKEWGIAGTSIGSLLIIVALITMVGIGSGNTYATAVADDPLPGTTSSSKSSSSSSKSSSSSSSKSSSSSSSSKTCPAGEYKESEDCFACPAGYYCPGNSYSTKVACPSGTTSKVGSTSSSDCKSTKTCPAGEYKESEDCFACPAGYYCPGNSYSTKVACPSGTTSKVGSTSSSDCKSTSSSTTCEAGKYYDGSNGCIDCPAGFYCPGGTFSHETADINGNGKRSCPENATCPAKSSTFLCNTGYIKSGDTCVKTSSGDSGGSSGNPSGGSGGNPSGGSGGNPSTPSNPSQGTGGNGNGGNSSDVNNNPHTATKAPLVVAVIGMLSMGLGTVVYFKGKKEINTEI